MIVFILLVIFLLKYCLDLALKEANLQLFAFVALQNPRLFAPESTVFGLALWRK